MRIDVIFSNVSYVSILRMNFTEFDLIFDIFKQNLLPFGIIDFAYLCPNSCVIVCANVIPLSSLTLQLRSG